MTNFEIGTVVKLKSGGPDMTVQAVGNYGLEDPKPGVSCIWFDPKLGQHVEKIFTPETIEAVF